MTRENASTLLDSQQFAACLDRLTDEIIAATDASKQRLAFVGIRSRGVPLAQRLAAKVEARNKTRPALGILDITLYRDDLTERASQPILRGTDLAFDVDDSWIILVDDVLYTGRTVRAAITALVDFGRPRKIELLVMVDRGGRELPIHADYAGTTLQTNRNQTVKVHVSELDELDEVLLVEALR